MTLFRNLNQAQMTLMAVSTALLVGGCCSSSKSSGGGSYSYTPPPYSTPPAKSSGAAETTTEVSSGNNTVIPLYEESLAVGTRQVEEGSVKLKKVVKTETVNQPVQLRRETVTIERQPASGQSSAAPENAFKEGETVIQLWREEPVVETRVVPAGQIVASRKSEIQQSSVQRELRKESIDVDKGNAQNVIISDNVMSSGGMGGSSDTSSQASGKSSGGAITEVSAITSASDPSSLAQRSVHLSNVRVEKVWGNRVIEIHDDGGRPCYARLNETMPNVKEGDVVNITGTTKMIPSTMSDLGLGEDVKNALKGQQVFIEAQKFEVTNR